MFSNLWVLVFKRRKILAGLVKFNDSFWISSFDFDSKLRSKGYSPECNTFYFFHMIKRFRKTIDHIKIMTI